MYQLSVYYCRCVLSRFSWLSVASLVAAAEASIAPVRLGVAKPLGASSVASEYQQASSYGYTPSSYSRRSALSLSLLALLSNFKNVTCLE